MPSISAHDPATTDFVESNNGSPSGQVQPEPVKVTPNTPSAAALAAFHLYKSYGKRCVVDDVGLHVEKGEVVGLLGANGAGKTTTFYMIIGLERPDAGVVRLGERELTRLPMYLRARLGLGYLPQEPSVFRKMTTAQNILAVLETMGLRRRQRLTRLEELLEEFGIAHVRNTRGDALSGVSADARRSRGRWLRNRSTFCWTNRSPASIPRPSMIFKM